MFPVKSLPLVLVDNLTRSNTRENTKKRYVTQKAAVLNSTERTHSYRLRERTDIVAFYDIRARNGASLYFQSGIQGAWCRSPHRALHQDKTLKSRKSECSLHLPSAEWPGCVDLGGWLRAETVAHVGTNPNPIP